MTRRAQRHYVRGTNRLHRSVKLEQLEARMMMAFDTIDIAFAALDETETGEAAAEYGPAEAGFVVNVQNGPGEVGAAPVFTTPIAARGAVSNVVTTTKISLSASADDDGGARKLGYSWTIISQPDGSTARFSKNLSNAAKKTDLILNRTGDYEVQLTVTDRDGESVSMTETFTVAPVIKNVLAVYNNATLKSGKTVKSPDATQSFTLNAYDQFGQLTALPQNAVWTLMSKPTGSNPQVSVSGNDLSVTFDKVGKHTLQMSAPGSKAFRITFDVTANIQTLDLTAAKTTLAQGERLKLTVSGTDQFGAPVARLPKITWTATNGAKIASNGTFTAPKVDGASTVTATIGSVSDQITLNVGTPLTSEIQSLVQTYFADGSISREDMIAILRKAGEDGQVNTLELTQLRTLVSSADNYNVPEYVQVLASNVVNTSPANLHYQGTTLGNLTAGNTGAQLDKLVNKWFLGLDRPALYQYAPAGAITYAFPSGQLFNGDPSFSDQRQGLIGDCYFISSLGSIALNAPEAIENMFIDNGDGTYTVRFYTGQLSPSQNGFVSGTGVADYVTVDRAVAAYSNATRFAYSNFGQLLSSGSNALWIALAEKAYAQWNETGRAGQDGTNSYAGIEGGWMGTVYAQVLGYNATNYSVAVSSSKTALINALNNGNAVTIGTKSSPALLVGGHAYSVSSYDAGTDRFTLYNPWGTQHPAGPLSWAEIQANCDWFSTIDPSGSVAPQLQGGAAVLFAQQAANTSGDASLVVAVFVIETSNHVEVDSVSLDTHDEFAASNEQSADDSHTIAANNSVVYDAEDESGDADIADRIALHLAVFEDIESLLALEC